MTDRIETVIAEAQNDHRGRVDCVGPDAWDSGCSCGWSSGYFYDEESGDTAQFAHDAHVSAAILAALKAARIAVVELPEPDDDHHDGIAFWTAQDVGVHDRAVVTRFDPGSEAIYFNPAVAREIGMAMLAAADAAEVSQ